MTESVSLNEVDSTGEHQVRTDLYEEKRTPQSGIGAFATTFIPAGTRIFCEEPLLMLPNEAYHLSLYKAVKDLPENEEASFWALAASINPGSDISHIADLRSYYHDNEETLGDFNLLVEKSEKAWSIYETNRFTVRYSGGIVMYGLFPNCARLNHSCAPNVFHRFNPRIKRMTIHALRDIAPGEELFTSYIDVCHPTVVRRQLLKHWGFRCHCTACSSLDGEKDACRKQLEWYLSKINRQEEKRGSQGDGAEWTRRDYERCASMVQKCIRMMEDEELAESDTLGILCSLAARYAIKLERTEQAIGWAERAVDIERKCLGEDSREFQEACELLESCHASSILGTATVS
ncbi:SET domain-containing protein [Thozetella sp. PMI_491]|nr:SET domain-containing protein [Thozetella sp. PMI_491]